jgi:bacteriorhodopsin
MLLVLVVALTALEPALVVVVVLVSCAHAALSAKAQAAPATNIFLKLFCFMFVLWFG